jgi:lysophospholipase L1-like esterase
VTLRYLALGDSYTIGVGATAESNNFPNHLAQRLQSATGRTVELCNPAVNGFTAEDLIRTELDELQSFRPHLVSILIGANDIVHRRRPDEYRESLRRIYDAVRKLELPPGQVLSISVPDWSAVPAAGFYGSPQEIRSTIETFNDIARDESQQRHFIFADVSDLSRSRVGEPGWLADDGLHPADRQYAAWAEQLWEVVGPVWTRL